MSGGSPVVTQTLATLLVLVLMVLSGLKKRRLELRPRRAERRRPPWRRG